MLTFPTRRICRRAMCRRALLVFTLFLLVSTSALFGQSKGSGGGSQAGGAGGGNQGGGSGGGGTPSANGQQSSSSTSRIEASVMAYEASDKIAAHIADQVKGMKLIIYDAQSFAALQSYDAYAVTVSTLEAAFTFGSDNKSIAGLPDAQTIISTLAMVRSSTEYTTQPVDINLDALIAQVAHNLPASSTVVPKFLLLEHADLDSPANSDIPDHDCADIDLNIPSQLACLIRVRAESQNNPNFTATDKLFQTFLGSLIGSSGVAKSPAPAVPAAPATTDGVTNQNQNPSPAPPALLPSIIAGRRLRAQLNPSNDNKRARLLVLETTAAGGSYRLLHNFWVEVFWRTPTPAFNGGATVTYLLIDPFTSTVEKSEVLSYVFKYSKFKKMAPAPNPIDSWQK
jgi:hypothetical protein